MLKPIVCYGLLLCVIFYLFRATTKALKVTSGKEAIEIISKSRRMLVDLSRGVELSRMLQNFPIKIAVRKWHYIDPQWEFRGFVYNNKLTALTQYFSYCYFPEVAGAKQETEKKILDFFDTIKGKIQHSCFVIDFGISNNQVIVIELNPFNKGTGTSHFKWAEDQQIMREGPFEFRVTMSPNPTAQTQGIPTFWRDLLEVYRREHVQTDILIK